MLAILTVTNLNDATVTGAGSAPGTLRQAIFDANVANDPDVIEFAPNLAGELRLSIADDSALQLSALLITSPITIQGNAAGITIRRDVTAPEMRFFRVALGGDLTLISISLMGGITRGTSGGSGEDGGTAFAGAVYNQGNLQIIASTLYNNSAIGGNAGASANSGTARGGAIFNDGGVITVRNSTISGNSVFNGSGTVFSGSFGGELYSKNGFVTVDNSTMTNGTASSGRELYIIGLGSGQIATAQIHSSIIAQANVLSVLDVNITQDLGGQVIVTGSNNLIRRQNDYESITVSTDDPMLGPLTTNGGPTRTHALLEGSPAIGQGSNPHNLVNDQRGDTYARVVGGTIDIGAFELQTVATPELPGDYNRSQSVDAADFVIWRKTKGADVPPYTGADGNGNSKIDDADYNVWRGQFGAAASATMTAAATELISVQFDQQPEARTVHTNDLALFEPLAERAGMRPGSFEIDGDYRTPGEQSSQVINRHERDQALVALTASRFERLSSTGSIVTSDKEIKPDALNPEIDDISEQLDAARIGEMTPECELPGLSRLG